MTHSSAPDRRNQSDLGTSLGAGTRILTAIVAAPLRIVRWLGRLSRTTGHLIATGARWVGRTVGVVLSRAARRVNRIVTWCARCLRTFSGRFLGGIARALVSGAHSLAVAIGAILRPVARLVRQAVQGVVEPIARGLRAAGAALAHATDALLGALADALSPLRQLTAFTWRMWREALRLFGRGLTACAQGARWIGAHAVRVLYSINVAIARARAEHALGIDDATGVEDAPAMPTGADALSCSIEVIQNP